AALGSRPQQRARGGLMRPTIWTCGLVIAAVAGGCGIKQDSQDSGGKESQAGSSTADAPHVLCTDPRGCPDFSISVPLVAVGQVLDQRSFAPSTCSVQEGEARPGTRRFLRFNSTVINLGPGEAIVGDPFDHPEWFDYNTCHGHPHFIDYTAYRLWT